MSQLFHFAYISKLSHEYDATDVVDIIKVARKNNLRDQLTGILIYDGERFFQYIEGPKDLALNLLQRLEDDVRHVDMSLLFENAHPSERFYDDWHLAYTYSENNDCIDALATHDYVDALNKIKGLKTALDFEP